MCTHKEDGEDDLDYDGNDERDDEEEEEMVEV
jgi:hypothetical protein